MIKELILCALLVILLAIIYKLFVVRQLFLSDLDLYDISEPLETDVGIYIFQIIDRDLASVAPLNTVKQQIQQRLQQEQFKHRFQTWLDELKANAYVEIK